MMGIQGGKRGMQFSEEVHDSWEMRREGNIKHLHGNEEFRQSDKVNFNGQVHFIYKEHWGNPEKVLG